MDYLTTEANEIFNHNNGNDSNNNNGNTEATLTSIGDGQRPGSNTPVSHVTENDGDAENEMKPTTSYVVCDKPKIDDESFVNLTPAHRGPIRHYGHCCNHLYNPFEVKRLTETARIPTRGSIEAAGWDIYADEDVIIQPGKSNVVSTGIAIATPNGTYARLAPRSGLALRNGIDTGAGICDSDYRGEIKVILFNHTENTPFEVHRGDRICQMIITPYVFYGQLTEVNKLTRDSERGTKGFGSTGMK